MYKQLKTPWDYIFIPDRLLNNFPDADLLRQDKMLCKLRYIKTSTSYTEFQLN